MFDRGEELQRIFYALAARSLLTDVATSSRGLPISGMNLHVH